MVNRLLKTGRRAGGGFGTLADDILFSSRVSKLCQILNRFGASHILASEVRPISGRSSPEFFGRGRFPSRPWRPRPFGRRRFAFSTRPPLCAGEQPFAREKAPGDRFRDRCDEAASLVAHGLGRPSPRSIPYRYLYVLVFRSAWRLIRKRNPRLGNAVKPSASDFPL